MLDFALLSWVESQTFNRLLKTALIAKYPIKIEFYVLSHETIINGVKTYKSGF